MSLYFKGLCVFCLICILHLTAAHPIATEESVQIACWKIKNSRLKFCIEETSEDGPPEAPTNHIRRGSNLSTLFRPEFYPSMYNRIFLNDYNGYVPFTAKRNQMISGLLPDSKDADTNAEDIETKQSINKRPFDSISYNTGLGGFKRTMW